MITPELARELRYLARDDGWSGLGLARAKRLPARTVQHVLVGHTFRRAGGPIRIKRKSTRVISDRAATRIRKLRGRYTSPQLAKRYGCSPSLIRHIWTRRCHR
jgi:hypothetical protein